MSATKTMSQALASVLEDTKARCAKKGIVLTVESIVYELCNYRKDADNYAFIIGESAQLDKLLAANGLKILDVMYELSYEIKRLENAEESQFEEYLARAEKRSGDEVKLSDLVWVIFDDPTPCLAKLFFSTVIEQVEEASARSMMAPDKKPTESAKPAPREDSDVTASEKAQIKKLVENIREVRKELLKSVIGQENAVKVFINGYFRGELAAALDKDRRAPRSTFLFAGPPGVGKTMLSELVAKQMGIPFKRFNMSDFSGGSAVYDFVGIAKNYNDSKPGGVTGFVAKNPRCILLFDEIEKASPSVIRLFLQILDGGFLRDDNLDKNVKFTDAVIIMTTNAGRKLYEHGGSMESVPRKVIIDAIKNDRPTPGSMPYFPPEIISRFATGNIAMFNNIDAMGLCRIAQRELERFSAMLEKTMGISMSIDPNVYSAMLLADGGRSDARTIRSRAEAFFSDEIYELFRIADANPDTDVSMIEKVKVTADIPRDKAEIVELFEDNEPDSVLVFSDESTTDRCRAAYSGSNYLTASSIEQAEEILISHTVNYVIIDLHHGIAGGENYLDYDDIQSEARDFLGYLREKYMDMPVYILLKDGLVLTDEERISYLYRGVRGTFVLPERTKGEFAAHCEAASERLKRQRSVEKLARASKMLSFTSAQRVSSDCREAEIILMDMKLRTAVDSEDAGTILASKPDVTFDRVIGADEAKKELKFFIEYMKNPGKYLSSGLSAPKGVILYGPPGTGKTLLAKAMAGECNATFIAAEGNQFMKKYVGEGPESVHEIFARARKYAPSILFLDEIDAIAKERTGSEFSHASEEVLTAFLTEMDGFRTDVTKPVFVLAATNFNAEPGSPKSLDAAFLRRFDRRIYVDLPDLEGRLKFMKMKSQGKAFEVSDGMLDNLAMRSTGMSLAQLEQVFELALRTASRSDELKVTDQILDEAFETSIYGEAKDWDKSLLERVARHEAGHALISWIGGDAPSYMTIVARGNHGGYMQHSDGEKKPLHTKRECLSRICTSLGGRAAELVYYGDESGISTGASGDLSNATSVAKNMICSYGMFEEFGMASIDEKPSEKVLEYINKLLSEQLERAKGYITRYRTAMDALVAELMVKNHLSGDEIKELFEKNGVVPETE
ncbi:MAG: AAA family ATPase [Oscillospiraceae bacterium]